MATCNAASGSLKSRLFSTKHPANWNLPIAEPVIDGALRKGEVGLLVGGTKTAKTWTVMHLHCAMATRQSWLGYKCSGGRTLLIDGELSTEAIFRRLAKVKALYGDAELDSDILPLRPEPTDIDGLLSLLQEVEPNTYSLVTIDPLFRLMPGNADENSQAYVTSLFTKLTAAAIRMNSAILCIHHTTKGSQASKGVTDLDSGAGAQSRAPDWHGGLRLHSVPGCVSLHAIARDFPATKPSVWRLNIPAITHEPELDAEDLHTGRRNKGQESKAPKPAKAPKPTWQDVAAIADSEPRGIGYFAAKVCNGKEHMARSLLRQAVEMGALHCWEPSTAGGATRWANIAPPLEGGGCEKKSPTPPVCG